MCKLVIIGQTSDEFADLWESGYRDLRAEVRFDGFADARWSRYGAVEKIVSFERLLRAIALIAGGEAKPARGN
jgi:hypothetical protein